MSDERPAKRHCTDDERPAKRHRTEDVLTSAEKAYVSPPSVVPAISNPALPTQHYKRDEDVWFSTGNIVLVANYEVAFRIYRDVLSRRSEVFRGLFEFPQLPPGVERGFETEKMDGCEVVHLSDAPSDLKQLLLVIYCRKNFFYLKDEPISVPFHTLSALIRMAHKYDVQDVYETALSRLQKYYTSDLEWWLKPCDRKPYVETTVLDAVAVIDLAYRIDAPELLPTAYLICCSLDGHTRLGNRVHEPILGDLGPWAHKRILTGKARLAQRRALRVLALLRASPCDTCSRPEKCALAVQKALKQLDLARLERGLHDGLVLDEVPGWLWTGGLSERLCEKCTAAQNRAHDRLRWETWCALPEIFDVEVPKWPKVSDIPQVEDGEGGEGEGEDEDEDEAEAEGEGGNT